MHNQVENPMRENRSGQDQPCAHSAQARHDLASRICQRRPAQHAQQTVRIRHVIQIERVGSGDAGDDPHLLNPQQNKDRPQHINKLHGDKQQPKWNALFRALGGKADAVMTGEQS